MFARHVNAADAPAHQDTAIRSRTLNSWQGMELDSIADVLHFLHNIQPLPGTDYTGDDAFKNGHMHIMEWLERRVRAIGDGDQTESEAASEGGA